MRELLLFFSILCYSFFCLKNRVLSRVSFFFFFFSLAFTCFHLQWVSFLALRERYSRRTLDEVLRIQSVTEEEMNRMRKAVESAQEEARDAQMVSAIIGGGGCA